MVSSQLARAFENPSARVNDSRFGMVFWNGGHGFSIDHPRFVYASAFRMKPLFENQTSFTPDGSKLLHG